MMTTIRAYHDFVLFVYNPVTDDLGRVSSFTVRVFSSPVGEGELAEAVELNDYADLKLRVRELERRQMEPSAADALVGPAADQEAMDAFLERQMALGARLAALLLPPYAREMFWRSMDWLNADEGLRLRLRIPDVLSDLPWEYLFVPRHRGERQHSSFLALHPQLSIARHEALAIPAQWFAPDERRRIIIAMATPEPFGDYPRLAHLPHEQALIKQALEQAAGVEPLYIPDLGEHTGEGVIPGAEPRMLTQVLRSARRTDIFHFSGHGDFTKRLAPSGDDLMGRGAILLAGEDNQAVAVTADRLLEMIRGHGVRLVVLGACETARSDAVHVWSSVAGALQKGEIPAVVAMQFSVYDTLTARFMGRFYEALAAGAFIDEAVYLGRQAIRDETMFQNPAVRDWGAPVLYLRTPDGRVFAPVTNRTERRRAERRVEGRFGVHRAWHDWTERGRTVDEDGLRELASRGDDLAIEPTQALLLLRSAVRSDSDERPWLAALGGERGTRLVRHLDDPSVDRPAGPAVALRILGLDVAGLQERPPAVGPLAWSAVGHQDVVTRRTAALALTVLPPAPREALQRLENALRWCKGWRLRWQRRVELYGTLCDAEPAAEDLKRKLSPIDRLGIWLWRVRRRALREQQRQHLIATTLGGMCGAGIAVGVWRGLIALVGRAEWPVYLNIYFYLGLLLGLFAAGGMGLAEPTLLRGRTEKQRAPALARRAAVLGWLFFAIGHLLVALLNDLDLSQRPLMALTGPVAGIGLMLALYGQPRTGRQLGLARWLLRLAAAGLAFALAQLFVFWLGGDYPAGAISLEPLFFWRNFRRYDLLRQWLDSTPNWEVMVLTLDAAVTGLVLAAGMLFGVTASTRWLAWWRQLQAGRPSPEEM